MSDIKNSIDAVIIGGGHNGLVCANILAKKNKKVLICEARDTCGGLINDEITNFIPPINASISNTLGRISVKYQPKNTIALSESGEHIRLNGNQHIDHKSISAFSTKDADSYIEFNRKMSLFSKIFIDICIL